MLNPCRVNLEKIIGYLLSKRSGDGGYLSYQYMDIFESSAEDTYYAISSLNVLGKTPPRAQDTVRFLLKLQHEDGSYTSLPVAYFAVKALNILNAKPRNVKGAIKYLSDILRSTTSRSPENSNYFSYTVEEHFLPDGSLKSFDATSVLVEAEVPTALTNVSLAVEGLITLGHVPLDNRKEIVNFVLGFRKPDGSFGVLGTSIDSVYHAVKTLSLLGYDIGELASTRDWVLRCENPDGGFSIKPGTRTYFIEHTYYGVETLSILGLKPRYPSNHAELVCSHQNEDGGFRRSPALRTSTLENTYYAVQVLDKLGYF